MIFTLLVEGKTERSSVHLFLQRWLNPRLDRSVAIRPVNLGGSGNYRKHFVARATKELGSGRCFAAIGLLDYYGSDLARNYSVADDRKHLQDQVGDSRFRQHFAVHEIEAWLLSDPSVLPSKVRNQLPNRNPEQVNLSEPPSKLLARLYQKELNKKYKKAADGARLFQRLDPDKAYASCPHLKIMLDEMLTLARDAGF